MTPTVPDGLDPELAVALAYFDNVADLRAEMRFYEAWGHAATIVRAVLARPTAVQPRPADDPLRLAVGRYVDHGPAGPWKSQLNEALIQDARPAVWELDAGPAAGRDLTADDVRDALGESDVFREGYTPVADRLNEVARPAVARTDGQPRIDEHTARAVSDLLDSVSEVVANRAASTAVDLGELRQDAERMRLALNDAERSRRPAVHPREADARSGVDPAPPIGPKQWRDGWRNGYEQCGIDRAREADEMAAAPADDTGVQGWGDAESADFIERARAATAVGSFTAQFDHVYDPSGDLVCESADHSTAVRIAAALSAAPADDTAAPDPVAGYVLARVDDGTVTLWDDDVRTSRREVQIAHVEHVDDPEAGWRCYELRDVCEPVRDSQDGGA